MVSRLSFLLSALIVIVLCRPAPGAEAGFQVAAIEFAGLQRVTEGTVYNYLPVNIGDELTSQRMREAIRALYATGFFADVELRRDGETLIVAVKERPSIESFEIKGNKDIKTEELTRVLRSAGLASGKTFDRSVLEGIQQELTDQYFSRGKYSVRISTSVDEQPDNRVRVKIDIKEGARARIRQIAIIGNAHFKQKRILESLELKTPRWNSWYKQNDRYSKESLQGDLEKLRSFYQDRGYANFQIESAQVAIAPEKDDMFITVSIVEGEVYRISDVKIAGITKVPEPELRKFLLVRPGQLYSQKLIATTQELIQNRLGAEGYAFAKVDPVPKLDETLKLVGLTFLVDPGKRVYVRHINFAGVARTNDVVFRRQIRQLEGSWVSNIALERSKQRLQQLPYVEKVEFEKNRVNGSEDLVDVDWTIKEGSSASLQGGIGYSASQSFSLNGSVADANWLGTGERLALDLNTGYYQKVYSFSHTKPYVSADGLSRTVSIAYSDRRQLTSTYSDFSTEAYMAGLEYGWPVTERQTFRFGSSLQHVELATSSSSSRQLWDWTRNNGNGYLRKSGDAFIRGTVADLIELSTGWSYESRDRMLFPTQGAAHVLNLTSTLPGGGLEFMTATYRYTQYFRLPLPIINAIPINIHTTVAYGTGFGNTTELPPNRHSFVGGPDSVRGFRESTLGPRDSLGNPYGGDFAIYGGAEAIIPVPEKFQTSARVMLFFDMGQAYFLGSTKFQDKNGAAANYGVDLNQLRSSVGIAVQWLAPMGLFRFSFAKPINYQKETWNRFGDEREAFQFSVGNAF